MNENEIISTKALRKLDELFLQNKLLRQNKEFQLQVIEWAKELLAERRKEWGEIHTALLDAVIKTDRRTEAQKKSKERDKKYAPFREYFKKI